MRVAYVVIARIPPAGVERFQRYEAAVLPLLEQHGGRLERRLRTADERTEIHVVTFGSAAQFAAYRDDPRRTAHADVLASSGARIELLGELHDV